MNITIIAFWAFFLCLLVSLVIFTFPVSFAREGIYKGIRKIQIKFIVLVLSICILAIVFDIQPYFNIAFFKICIEIRIALMLIPIIACVAFTTLLYYPSIRFLVKSNFADQETINKLFTCMFNCAYNEKDNRDKALKELEKFLGDEEQFAKQYGIYLYLVEYKNHSSYPVTNKPPESMINFVLNRISQVKHDIDFYEPIPFPNIGLVLSFALSTILTIFLSIITLT